MTRKRTRKKVVRSRLGWVIERARTLGFKVDHAMSWESVGLACGATGVRNKRDAQAFLQQKFDMEVRPPRREKTLRSAPGDSWKARAPDVNSDAFLASYEWRRVRMEALKRHGARCQCCGATPADGVRMHVDHIKPRRLFPQLALDVENLQVLCELCNHGKGNWDTTDWRGAHEPRLEAERDLDQRLAHLLATDD